MLGITDSQRRITAERAPFALRDGINWVHQPAFDKAFADLTGAEPESDEWRREVNWSFTGDDQSWAD